MFDLKDVKIKDEEAEMISEVMLLMIFRVNKIALAGAAIWLQLYKNVFHGIKYPTRLLREHSNNETLQLLSSIL